MLNEPIAHVVGYLECLWNSGYETASAFVGSADDVENAAEYPHEDRRGRLFVALLECGFIDKVGESSYAIHDLLENAPTYVVRRYSAESQRKNGRVCAKCGVRFFPTQKKAKYCSPACRTSNWRQSKKRDDTERHVTLHTVTETPRDVPNVTTTDVYDNPIRESVFIRPNSLSLRSRVSGPLAEDEIDRLVRDAEREVS